MLPKSFHVATFSLCTVHTPRYTTDNKSNLNKSWNKAGTLRFFHKAKATVGFKVSKSITGVLPIFQSKKRLVNLFVRISKDFCAHKFWLFWWELAFRSSKGESKKHLKFEFSKPLECFKFIVQMQLFDFGLVSYIFPSRNVTILEKGLSIRNILNIC